MWLSALLLLLSTLSRGAAGPVVFYNEERVATELEWEELAVADEGAVTSVSVAALPAGAGVYLHYVKSLVTADEAVRLIKVCDNRQGWIRSLLKVESEVTVNGGSSGDKEQKRTSSSCPLVWPDLYKKLESDPAAFGAKGAALLEELGLALAVSRRVARLMGVDESVIEPLQLVRYQHGEYYSSHHDHGAYYGFQSEDRPYTLLLFLNSVPEADGGGHTAFPTLNIKVLPQRGDAILWANVDFSGAAESEERGSSVLADAVHEAVSILHPDTLKYVCNVWVSSSAESVRADVMARARGR